MELLDRLRQWLRDKRWIRESENRLIAFLNDHPEVDVLVFNLRDKKRLFGDGEWIKTIDVFECDHGPVICGVAQWARKGKVYGMPEDHKWLKYTCLR